MLKKPNYLTVPAALKELEKIVMIRQLDGVYRLDHAVTATQKNHTDTFGLNEGQKALSERDRKYFTKPVRKQRRKEHGKDEKKQ